MPLEDYSHHNEEAQRIWWEEEGKHENNPCPCPEDWDNDFYDDWDAEDEE